MRRLDWYTIKEILGPLGLGFLIYTFILLLQVLFKSAELIISRGVPASTVGELMLLSLPSIVVLTIPMSFLFGILIAVGRLSADSELTAMRASGVSLFSLYRPILMLSLVLFGFNAYLMIQVLPKGNTAVEALRLEIATQGLNEEIEPRRFYPGYQDRLLYVFERPGNEPRWRGAFLAAKRPFGADEVMVAEWGQAETDPETEQVQLFLEQAFNHRVDLQEPERYEVILNDQVSLAIDTPGGNRSTAVSSRDVRSLNLAELQSQANNESLPDLLRNLARVEFHKKFAIPATCLVFGLLALPLGITRNRGGRSSGFAVSLGVILVYYVLLNWGEELATNGDFPAGLAVWFSNLVMVVAGFVLLTQRNRDKSVMLQGLDRWIQQRAWSGVLRRRDRRAERRNRIAERRKQNKADLVLRLPHLHLRFPNRMDRYVLQTFGRVLGLTLLSGLTIYVIADLTDKVDEVMENQIGWDVVFAYYKYKSFAILYQIAPIIVLVATLVTFGLLSRTNEITAIKALGMSLYRLSIPVILAAALLATAAGLVQSEVLAASNQRVEELEAVIQNRDVTRSMGIRRADRQWLDGGDRQLYNYLRYDPEARTFYRLQIFRFDERYQLSDRLMVDRATYVDDGWWQLEGGWARAFDGPLETHFETLEGARKFRLGLAPEELFGETRLPASMTYQELREHIGTLQGAGQPTPVLEVALHNKIAYPAISLVMALVALPFSFRLGRRGALYGIGLSIILGIVFMAALATFTALGEAEILPPIVAVWSPGAIFAVFSLYLFLGIET